MAIRKENNGRWTAVVKDGRRYIGARTFTTQREAKAWEAARKAELANGVDPRAGRVEVAIRLTHWLADREGTVAPKTLRADQDLPRVLPRWFTVLHVSQVSEADIARLLGHLVRTRSHASATRIRASLSAFFADCARSRLVSTNPVTAVRVPRRVDPPVEMRPFTEAEVEETAASIAERNLRLSEVVLVAAWTGLRWGELRELRVADFAEVPVPVLVVQRSCTEGQPVKGTKSGRSRRVPVADRVLPLIRTMVQGKGPTDLLVTTDRGAQLHASAFKRTSQWATNGRGRRLHDLRHTAACLWLSRGVDLTTVQAWMGHADIATTNRYTHYLGTAADRAGLDLLNAPGANRGQITEEGGRAGNPSGSL